MQGDTRVIQKPMPPKRVSNPEKLMIGNRIAKARKLRGMTQKELSEAVGVTGGAVGQWEIGRGQPSRGEMEEAVAEALGVSVQWLLYGIEDDAVKAETNSEKMILRLSRQLRPGERRQVIDFIRGKVTDSRRDH